MTAQNWQAEWRFHVTGIDLKSEQYCTVSGGQPMVTQAAERMRCLALPHP